MWMHVTARSRFGILVVALIAFCASDWALADPPSVTAVLSSSEAAVDETVQLQIIVNGSGAKPPQHIGVDGLEINYTGDLQESQISFGAAGLQTTSKVTYTYTILPLKAGTFTIPPQTIRVAGDSLNTPGLTLRVVDSPGAGSRPNRGVNRGARPVNASKLAFAELIVPQKTAFVGEVVPAEIRLGFDPRSRPGLDGWPGDNRPGIYGAKAQAIRRENRDD